MLLQQWVMEQAQRRPDATAIVMDEERWTYGRLEAESARLATMLREVGCGRGDRVCFAIPKSPLALVTILGILKADGMYTPLDSSGPAARAAKVIEACEPRAVLAAGGTDQFLAEALDLVVLPTRPSLGWLDRTLPGVPAFPPDFFRSDVDACDSRNPATENTSADPAYILFTSGSTGTPKGVVITHENVIQFINWAVRYFQVGPDDRMSGHIPLYFDLSVFDMFGTYAAGAELHLIPPELSILPQNLAQFIRTSNLTQWFSVPSVLNNMAKFDVVRPDDFPSLNRLLWCGEVLPTPSLMYWMRRLPKVRFTNLYGPTETTIASSYYTVPDIPTDEKVSVPIGRPCDGETLQVLDEQRGPVPVGALGELYIGGVGLSPGYWRDPEKTARAFVEVSAVGEPAERMYRTGDLAKVGPDGLVYYVGRADTQIKSRGYRIELGEIETALHAILLLTESAVVAIPSEGFEGWSICSAYVPANGESVPPKILRKELAKVLPSYMIPVRWMEVPALPKTPNGKIDRPRIRAMFETTIRRAEHASVTPAKQ